MTPEGIWTSVSDHGLTNVLGGVATRLIATEAVHHARGWDRDPPSLYRAFTTTSARSRGEVDRCWVEHIPLRAAQSGNLRDELRHLARHGKRDIAGSADHAWPPVAHLLVVEGWSLEYHAASFAQAERQRANRDHADIPGSVEVREAVAVTDERHLQVHRQRGQPPIFACRAVDEPSGIQLADNLLANLRRLHQSTSPMF